jgi:integrase
MLAAVRSDAAMWLVRCVEGRSNRQAPRRGGNTVYRRCVARVPRADDAARIGREDLLRWRAATIEEGRCNTMWNNRLSMIRQVLARGVADGKLPTNPGDGLGLPKGRGSSSRPPYTDEDATRILLATRKETQPSLRWAHWIMAFSVAREGEVLQLTGGDIRNSPTRGAIRIWPNVTGAVRRRVPTGPPLAARAVHWNNHRALRLGPSRQPSLKHARCCGKACCEAPHRASHGQDDSAVNIPSSRSLLIGPSCRRPSSRSA